MYIILYSTVPHSIYLIILLRTAYCIPYSIAYSTCDLFLEIAATAATVIRSGRSVLVVMRQFVVRQFLPT